MYVAVESDANLSVKVVQGETEKSILSSNTLRIGDVKCWDVSFEIFPDCFDSADGISKLSPPDITLSKLLN